MYWNSMGDAPDPGIRKSYTCVRGSRVTRRVQDSSPLISVSPLRSTPSAPITAAMAMAMAMSPRFSGRQWACSVETASGDDSATFACCWFGSSPTSLALGLSAERTTHAHAMAREPSPRGASACEGQQNKRGPGRGISTGALHLPPEEEGLASATPNRPC